MISSSILLVTNQTCIKIQDYSIWNVITVMIMVLIIIVIRLVNRFHYQYFNKKIMIIMI